MYLNNSAIFEKSRQEYVTFLGGSGEESRSDSSGNKIDAAGNAYVTGWTDSLDFPRVNAVQPTLGGNRDAFVSKLNPTGSALVYSIYLGGSGEDLGNGIAIIRPAMLL